jgi:hypothetical protein
VVAVATAGRHTIRLTHLAGGDAGPTIRLATTIGTPRSARLLGAHFVLRPGADGQ